MSLGPGQSDELGSPQVDTLKAVKENYNVKQFFDDETIYFDVINYDQEIIVIFIKFTESYHF